MIIPIANYNSTKPYFLYFQIFKKYWAGGVSGLDKEGHAVYFADFGNLDPKGYEYRQKCV